MTQAGLLPPEDVKRAMVLVLGLAMLVKGAGWLVDGGVRIARQLGISPMMIGLTIMPGEPPSRSSSSRP